MRGLNPYAYMLYFRTRLAISGGPSGPDRDGPGTWEIPRETRRKIPTRSYTLWDLSSCPRGFVFLVTHLIPQKHVTDSSFLKIRDFSNCRFSKCLKIFIYMCIHKLFFGFLLNKKFNFYFYIFKSVRFFDNGRNNCKN